MQAAAASKHVLPRERAGRNPGIKAYRSIHSATYTQHSLSLVWAIPARALPTLFWANNIIELLFQLLIGLFVLLLFKLCYNTTI